MSKRLVVVTIKTTLLKTAQKQLPSFFRSTERPTRQLNEQAPGPESTIGWDTKIILIIRSREQDDSKYQEFLLKVKLIR